MEKETILDSLGIAERRGMSIYESVIDKLIQECNPSISDVLKQLICDMDLDTKELVFASFIVGKLTSMDEENIARLLLLRNLRDVAQSIVDDAENNSENNLGI